jgi:hypothetical protein
VKDLQINVPKQLVQTFGCSLLVLGLPLQTAMASCLLQQLKGQEYAQLPLDLCEGYTDMLLGQKDDYEYGGVICDRQEGSYVLLQRLVAYNPPHQSIWKILEVQLLPKLQMDELILSEGCQHLQGSSDPILAIVRPSHTSNTYQTQKAWTVNLSQAKFHRVKAEQVICRDPFTITDP